MSFNQPKDDLPQSLESSANLVIMVLCDMSYVL